MSRIELIGLEGIGEALRGDSIGKLIAEACARQSIALTSADILVVAHKIVSKAEGRIVRLPDVTPSPIASNLVSVFADAAFSCSVPPAGSR